MNQKFIAYFRVSSKQQGASGLGLEAQKFTTQKYCLGKGEIIQEFIEVESGKKDQRVELNKAIQLCKKENAILVIAKLDRLSRNLTFISSLMDSGLEFICCDMPTATKFTIHIFAALAQQEREYISTRTKDALAAKKERGETLGNNKNLTHKGRLKGTQMIIEKANTNKENRQALHIIKEQREKERSYQQIADTLNDLDLKTRYKKSFSAANVHRIYMRYLKQEEERN